MNLNLEGGSSVRIHETAPAQDADPRMTRLVQARKTTNTGELNQLILDRHEMNERIDALVSKLQVETRKRLENDHEESKRLVREKQREIDDVQLKIDRLDQEAGRLGNILQKRQHAEDAAIAAQRGLSRFATKQEISEVEELVQKAKAQVQEMYERLGPVESQARYFRLTVLPKMNGELQTLISEEARLSSALSGESYHDPVSGLVLPAGAKF